MEHQFSELEPSEGPFEEISLEQFETPDDKQRQLATLMQRKFRDDLGKVVKGQDHVKDNVCVAMYNIFQQAYDEKIEGSNSHLMFIGDSGTGKTLTAETMSDICSVPFADFNMASVTPSGFVGPSFSDVFDIYVKRVAMFQHERRKAVSNVKMTPLELYNDCNPKSQGIIFLDEIDKLLNSRNYYVSSFRETVQDEILRSLQGETITADLWSSKEVDNKMVSGWASVDLHTKDLTFIVGGAFQGLPEIIAKRLRRSPKTPREELYAEMTSDDLIEYGFKPEFIGRVPVKIAFNRLTEAVLLDILKNSQKSPLEIQKTVMKKRYGVEAIVDDNIPPYLAQLALGYPQEGGRILKTLCHDLFLPMQLNTDDYVHPGGMIILTMDYAKKTLTHHERKKNPEYRIGF